MKIAVLLVVCLLVSSAYCSGRKPRVVPNGSSIVTSGEHITIEHPDGSSIIKRLSPASAARANDNGWIASVSSSNNYTYYSAEWVVPPIPVGETYQILYFKNSIMDIPVTGIIQVVLQFYNDYDTGVSSWTLSSWWTPYNGEFIQSTPVVVSPGDTVRGVLELIPGNKWNITGYVNGAKASSLQIAYTPNMYIEFPSHPGKVLATSSDTAAQSYLTVLTYDAAKTAGRRFTFTNDGYIRLAANPNLVLDVEGTLKEGARVLVYPRKNPVSLYQQWFIRSGRIYSKLGDQSYSLTVNTTNNRVVLTKVNPQSPYINYQGPAGGSLGQAGSAQWALEVYNVFQCQQYPPSNQIDVSNIVLKKGTSTVTPTWTPSTADSDCNVAIASSSSSSATVTWDSTIA